MSSIDRGIPLLVAAPIRQRRSRVFLLLISSVVAVGALLGLVWVHDFRTSANAPAPVRPPDPLTSLSDFRTVEISLTTPAWTKVHEVVTRDRLRTDRTLWRQMHFNDWDLVPEPIREVSLRAMVRAYAGIFSGPRAWRQMDASDWDEIPQPIRAMAYLRMIWYWARVEQVGVEFRLGPETLAQTIGGIVMAESWFEHRAVNENEWGNRDLGLAQCSDYCRETLAAMASRCDISFMPVESDYFNPWTATRIATLWFERELLLAGGDIDLAIRAYHRGQDHAMDEKGDAYVARVRRLRERYILQRDPSMTWRFLAEHIPRTG